MARRWLKIKGRGCECDDGGTSWDGDVGDYGDGGGGGHGDGGGLGGWGKANMVDEDMANSKYNIYEQLLLCFLLHLKNHHHVIIIVAVGNVLMMMISTSCTWMLMIAV